MFFQCMGWVPPIKQMKTKAFFTVSAQIWKKPMVCFVLPVGPEKTKKTWASFGVPNSLLRRMLPALCRFGGNCAKPHMIVFLLCVCVCVHPGPAVQPKYKRSVEHASGLANTGQLWPRGFTPFCACMPLDRSRLVFGGQVSVRCHIGIMRQAPQCVCMCACRCLLSAAAYLQEHS